MTHIVSSPVSFDAKGKKFLVISALFPPGPVGGAQLSAYEQALWLRRQGADVAVLTTAATPEEACRDGVGEEGLRMWRVWMPRPYPVAKFHGAPAWKKPIWHMQDHFDPRNVTIMDNVLDEFRPDVALVQVIQGIGYNALKAIARRGIPTAYFLHDLGLACIRMSMFKGGADCPGQCGACKWSSGYKASLLRRFRRLGLCSPSRANLQKLSHFFPTANWPTAVILNVNRYPLSTAVPVARDKPHFLYAGRLHSSKGVHVLLEAATQLAATRDFRLTVVGSGPEEAELRARYGSLPWCHFTGFIAQQELSNHLVDSDVLCIPSLWAENSPGVVIHALGQGVPVIGSAKGGIPELVEDGKNGLLVPPGDVAAWVAALEQVFDAGRLAAWRAYAQAHVAGFDQDRLGRQTLDFVGTLVDE